MKIFERDEKINFVDDNNVLVGFDNHQDCCEHFGWFLDLTPHGTGEIDDTPFNENDLDGYRFDTEYFTDCPSGGDEGSMAIFRLVSCWEGLNKDSAKAHPPIYLHLYNHHNGYYSHGFVFSKPLVIRTGSL